MTTFYLDPENGDDANDGTTFANRWKTLTNGATAARIAAGDVIRIIGCPDPTLVGSAVWNKDAYLIGTAYSISAVSNATPIQITTSTAHGLSTGDVVRIVGQTGNRYINGLWVVTVVDTTNFTLDDSVAAGAGGTASGTVHKFNHKAIVLATKVNQTIDMCEVAWTASGSVTSTTPSSQSVQGDYSVQLAIASGFTTGKVAYRTLPATLDLSGYQQVSLFIRSSTTQASGVFTLRLCSDTTGDTTVNTITLPLLNTNAIHITVDTGAALGASIASIALYAESDPGTVTINLDCIVACKAASSDDALTLNSMFGKNDGHWAAVGTIENRIVTVGCEYFSGTNSVSMHRYAGWFEDTETADMYRLKPLLPSPRGSTNWTVNESGITVSGGWNRTDMSTQTGEKTFINTQWDIALTISGVNDIVISDLGFVHCGAAIGINGDSLASTNITLHNISTAATSIGINIITTGELIDKIYITGYMRTMGSRGISNNGNGIQISDQFSYFGNGLISIEADVFVLGADNGMELASSSFTRITGNFTAVGCFSAMQLIRFIGRLHVTSTLTSTSCQYVFYLPDPALVYDAFVHSVVADTLVAGFKTVGVAGVYMKIGSWVDTNLSTAFMQIQQVDFDLKIREFDSSYPVLFEVEDVGYAEPILNAQLGNYGGVSTDHRIYRWPQGNIRSETSVRHTASGYAWKMSPEGYQYNIEHPMEFLVGRVYVEANKLVTVSGWVRRTHTDIKIGLKAPARQLAGMTTDYSDEITAAIDTWEELSFTFTPTEAGVVEVYAYCYGSITESGYVDDISISQAS